MSLESVIERVESRASERVANISRAKQSLADVFCATADSAAQLKLSYDAKLAQLHTLEHDQRVQSENPPETQKQLHRFLNQARADSADQARRLKALASQTAALQAAIDGMRDKLEQQRRARDAQRQRDLDEIAQWRQALQLDLRPAGDALEVTFVDLDTRFLITSARGQVEIEGPHDSAILASIAREFESTSNYPLLLTRLRTVA